jgi:hypothetical protein
MLTLTLFKKTLSIIRVKRQQQSFFYCINSYLADFIGHRGLILHLHPIPSRLLAEAPTEYRDELAQSSSLRIVEPFLRIGGCR